MKRPALIFGRRQEKFQSEGGNTAEDSSSRITLDFYVCSHVRKGEKVCDVTPGM